jgi:hypothetical protein
MNREPRSIEKSEINESALSLFKYFFWSKILDLEEAEKTVVTFSVQAKIKVLRGRARRFIDSRPYSFFKFVILPKNGIDVLNAEVALEIKNFEYWIQDLEPKRYVLIIDSTWDSFKIYEETVDKNLIPFNT